jgi:hypothetical protein
MTTYSSHVAAILSSAIVAIGFAGPVSADQRSTPEHTLLAQAASEDTMARCQQLFGLWSRHNTDGYAKPLDARMAMEDCQKGNYAAGVASLKRALERSQIPVPPAEAVAQTPAQPPAQLKPRGEKRRAAE